MNLGRKCVVESLDFLLIMGTYSLYLCRPAVKPEKFQEDDFLVNVITSTVIVWIIMILISMC